MALVMGVFMTACSDDDDYAISTTPLLSDNSVVTGSADVTATNATLHGTVSGLDDQASSAYTTGFKYGSSADALTETVAAAGGTEFSASIAGSVNETIYYQAYVTLQGKLTYTGQVSSCTLTNAQAITGEASDLTANTAKLSGSLSLAPSDVESGIVLSGVAGTERVRAGVRLVGSGDQFDVTALGLLPSTTYYYAAYLDLGSGVVYGDVKEFTTPAGAEFDVDNDLVDLGLSVKWAKYNIGAQKETDLGGLFGFGDNVGYNTSIEPSEYASADIYKTTTDLAYLTYNGKAMLPTADEYEELFRCCTTEWISDYNGSGVAGYKFTGPNGNSIFMPAAGSRTQATSSAVGSQGCYMTGSINPSDTQFALGYQFNASYNGRVSEPVYTAMSVRAVSLAKNVPFDKTKLYQKWYLENGQDGKLHVFQGPFTQWGAHDTYGTITNNEPNPYESIHWEMGTDNGWIGYTYGVDYGYMEFKEDGTYLIHRSTDGATFTDEEGTYTIDENAKTITIDKSVICGTTWLGTTSGTLNILTLTDNQLQIALPAGDGTYAYSVNFYSEAKRLADEEIPVSLLCVGSDWGGTWGSIVESISPSELDGQHTFTYGGSCNGAMVFTLDFQGLLSKYPNAMVRIDDIKCDGTSIKFDANNFCYGDIENNGNFRVELFNIWGKGATNSLINASPFSSATGVGSDPAFNFSSTLEFTYTIYTEPKMSYTPTFITINLSWGGPWDYNSGEAFEIKLNGETAKYEVTPNTFDVKYESTDHSAGSIMTFVQINDLYTYFPGTHSTLDDCLIDGTSVSYDKSKVLDAVDGNSYRIELWNMYGATSQSGCGFGTASADGVISELGFNSSIEVKYTIQSLFATPTWE